MKHKKGRFSAVIALALAVSVIMVIASSAFAVERIGAMETTPEGASVHKSVDISQITGEIAEPPVLKSEASAIGTEKEWYEYVYYSEEPVGYYYLSDNTRLSFYDPYDYASSLIMEVDDSLTDWSSNNALQISYTTGNSLTDTSGRTTNSTSTVQTVKGTDESTTTIGESTVTTTVDGKIRTYNYSKSGETTQTTDGGENAWSNSRKLEDTTTLKTMTACVSVEGALTIGGTDTDSGRHTWSTTTTSKEDLGSDDEGNSYTDYSHGYTENDQTTTATNSGGENKVISKIADRVTNATGVSNSSTFAMSTSNSTTITKTYNAGYFNASGAPLQWKIIKYTVMMPMKYQVEYLVDDEWVFGDYNYCLLTTIQGTCRAWLQNNVAYYEHWGTGEAVTWDEFWASFFTKENLIDAYKNRLYPD